jgi:hypothetical protein
MNGPSDQGSDIVVYFYQADYGPTIRIDTHSIQTVKIVKEIFQDLAMGKKTELEFNKAALVRNSNVEMLILKLVRSERRRTLRFLGATNGGPTFSWARSADGWSDCVDLIDGILQAEGKAGHQYLTNETIDDALIEFAFGE